MHFFSSSKFDIFNSTIQKFKINFFSYFQYSSIVDSLMLPQRYDNFNMTASQFSPGFRNSVHVSHHQDVDIPSHAYDINRMLQQHLSDGVSMGYRSNLQNIQENDQDENAENPPTPELSPQHRSIPSVMTGSVIKRASHREGPMNASHDRSLFHSLYGQTGGYEPVSSDLTTADMCLSTLYLHELFHRQNRRRSGSTARVIPSNQQHLWQLPHRDGSLTSSQSQTRSTTSPYPDNARPAAERTPLLNPKKT